MYMKWIGYVHIHVHEVIGYIHVHVHEMDWLYACTCT